MAERTLDVVGIGNAIVDVLAGTEDGFLEEQGLVKGSMALIDAERAERLYDLIGPAVECSGGSCGNTMAGLASLGAKGAYIGKVADDQLGRVFAHDLKAAGIRFDTPPLRGAVPTARSFILVTPDGQRTMNTYLGACVALGPSDIDPALIDAAKVVYLEGYLWDRPAAKEAFLKAAKLAHAGGGKVALSLSDPFCVDRHRAEFRDLVENHVDILFANEQEILSLYQVQLFDRALSIVRDHCETAALTRSAKGSVVVHAGEAHTIEAAPILRVVDTTGAGDQYAAGFLRGYTTGCSPQLCGRMGSIAAAEVIQHFGARPETGLARLVEAQLA
ncbi:MAG: adenosine kinase [Proteobacteria bacterium]|nr:adenosine kinase [Pseudomonadota bacterium]MBI3499708.1 adenosine kinase [Pseudomonadota bacterium]